jgi:hypothetical protein
MSNIDDQKKEKKDNNNIKDLNDDLQDLKETVNYILELLKTRDF